MASHCGADRDLVSWEYYAVNCAHIDDRLCSFLNLLQKCPEFLLFLKNVQIFKTNLVFFCRIIWKDSLLVYEKDQDATLRTLILQLSRLQLPTCGQFLVEVGRISVQQQLSLLRTIILFDNNSIQISLQILNACFLLYIYIYICTLNLN